MIFFASGELATIIWLQYIFDQTPYYVWQKNPKKTLAIRLLSMPSIFNCSQSQLTSSKKREAAWAGCHSIAETDSHSHSHSHLWVNRSSRLSWPARLWNEKETRAPVGNQYQDQTLKKRSLIQLLCCNASLQSDRQSTNDLSWPTQKPAFFLFKETILAFSPSIALCTIPSGRPATSLQEYSRSILYF